MKTDRLPSGSYRVRVTWTECGARHSKSFTASTATEAKKQAAAFRSTIGDAPAAADLTLAQAYARYIELKEPVLSPSTIREYRLYSRRYFGRLMKRRLGDLTPVMVQEEVSELSRTLSPKTVRNAYNLLTAVLKTYRPGFTPAARLPQKAPRDVKIPEASEVSAILERCDDMTRRAVALAAYQGLRMSEVLGLRWSDIDFERGTLTVSEALVHDSRNEIVAKAPKSVAGNRTVRLLAPAVEILSEAERTGDRVVDITAGAIKARYNRVLRSLGLSYTFHELRHYACSVMLSVGVPTKYAAAFLGHEGTNMVDRVYGHIMAGASDAYADRLNAFYKNGGNV